MKMSWVYSQKEIVLYVGMLLLLIVMVKLLSFLFHTVRKLFIQKDVALKVDPYMQGVRYPVSYWTEKGARPYQEDRYQALRGCAPTQPSLYGVFDGHGGERAAQHCKEFLLQCISTDPEWEGNPTKSISRSFHK
jgi:hypothetical protein